ncbi:MULTISPECIES: hypothetical protein [Acidobacterium]|uniref:hypothetical protein n=1 Tax=Acidobacterium TaxID=33973 RepID=UPI0005A10F99|nr:MULTISPECIES: hypothetical protein [Acidobacterium]HCT60929.1 hypothetical protein [Acidobacterium sp.]
MSAKKRWTVGEAERVLDHLADSIETGDATEVAADLKDSGHDMNDIASRMRAAALSGVSSFRKQALHRARQRYQESSAKLERRAGHSGGSPEERRQRFFSAIESRPELKSALTMQHRDLNELTETDIDSALEELEMLGALEDLDGSQS